MLRHLAQKLCLHILPSEEKAHRIRGLRPCANATNDAPSLRALRPHTPPPRTVHTRTDIDVSCAVDYTRGRRGRERLRTTLRNTYDTSMHICVCA